MTYILCRKLKKIIVYIASRVDFSKAMTYKQKYTVLLVQGQISHRNVAFYVAIGCVTV